MMSAVALLHNRGWVSNFDGMFVVGQTSSGVLAVWRSGLRLSQQHCIVHCGIVDLRLLNHRRCVKLMLCA